MTTEEQNAANIAILSIWDRGNESHLEFVASKFFMSGQSVAFAEDFAPHITISRSEEATLIINEVAKEDESVYKFTVRFLTLGDRRISRNFSLEVRGKITIKEWYCISLYLYLILLLGRHMEGLSMTATWTNFLFAPERLRMIS